jgi:hypothetical protein
VDEGRDRLAVAFDHRRGPEFGGGRRLAGGTAVLVGPAAELRQPEREGHGRVAERAGEPFAQVRRGGLTAQPDNDLGTELRARCA